MDPQNPNQPTPGGVITPESSGGMPSKGPASTAFVPEKSSKGRRKKVLFGVGAAVVTLGVAGYVFGYHLPNQPSNIYNQAMSNTAEGYDKLIDYVDSNDLAKKFEATEVSGTMSLNGQGLNGDGKFQAKSDASGNAAFSGDFGLSGIRINFEGMAKDVENSESPDIYFKVKGLKGIDQLAGMGLEQFDDKWVAIDHTFFDSYTQQAAGESTESATTPTQEQLVDAAKNMGEVNKAHLFTDDKSKAAFELKEYKGKEVVDGKDTMHYVVKANKKHLKAYADELGKALDKSKLNQWSQDSYKKNLNELINVQSVKDSVDDMKDDTFDLWVNTKTKLVYKIRIESSEKSYTDIGLNYDGGDQYPFFIASKNDNSSFNLNLSLNTKSHTIKVMAETKTTGEAAMNFKVNLDAKPGSGKVEVTPPTDAMPLLEALGGFMSANAAQSPTLQQLGGGANTTELDSFTITQ